MLYSPSEMNKSLAKGLITRGWSIGKANKIYVESQSARGNTIHKGYREMDGIKGDLGLEIQFGKYAFMGYDILGKMPIFHKRGIISAGIELVPAKEMAALMSTGVSYYEQIICDLSERGVGDLDIPVLIMAIGYKNPPAFDVPEEELFQEEKES